MGFWHHAVLALWFWVIGSAVGSFLNVCAYRLPRGLSVLRPRSRCPRCRSAIAARDNLPVVGWLILRGRCRVCGGAISPRYPAVELVTGLLFAGVYVGWIVLASADVWEQTGPIGVLFRLVLVWFFVGIAEVVALIIYDIRGDVIAERLERARKAGADPECSSDPAVE
jgi:leader peptidase (prepilin peptidase) / N-methyltransferase